MIIAKQCYDCGEEISLPESDVFDGIVARPVEDEDGKYIKIWLCEECRKDAEEGGEIYEEDIDIVDDIDENDDELDP